ncbi:MAG: polymorphic toxin-type HINT domain-containing protein [Alphaproteobacteria bacterium]
MLSEAATFVDPNATTLDMGMAAFNLLSPVRGDEIVGGANAVRRFFNRCCFAAGTLVATGKGLRPIEDIKVGDLVLARNEKTGETGLKPVTELVRRHDREIWKLSLSVDADGDGKATVETFETTDDHPWRTASGMWTQTMELKPGVRILRARGPPVTVVSVVRTGVMRGTYNFEVADWHTYFVGDAGVWVHNACGAGSGGVPKRGAGNGGNGSLQGIYEFPDQTAGGIPYVGQSGNIPARLAQHQRAGRLTPGTESTTPVVGGKEARELAEHNRIQVLTGGEPARASSAVSNQRDPIGPKRRDILDE